jgi:hypothetical protein
MGQPTAIELALIAATLPVDEEEIDWMKAQPKWRDLPRSELRHFQRASAARKLIVACSEPFDGKKDTTDGK